MRLVFAHEHHFLRSPDGRVWTETNLGRPFWNRYLEVFDSVRVVARTRAVAAVKDQWIRVDGDGVTVAPIPDFLGPRQFLQMRRRVRAAVYEELHEGDAVILRVPGTLGTIVAGRLGKRGYPFGVEVGGDPHDLYAPGSVRHPLRPLFRRWFARNLRQQCRAAAASLYVTNFTLQRRYPPGTPDSSGAKPSFVASNVEMAEEAFAPAPTTSRPRVPPLRLISIGSMSHRYKGHDLAISALHICRRNGLDVELAVVGDGRERPALEGLASALGVSNHVTFCGHLPSGDAVRRELDNADLFVTASRVEGLPRALIEAMGRGLPCIGTEVGGIPELLGPEALVPSDDAPALAARISEVCQDEDRRLLMAQRNWATAREYREVVLKPRRHAFYSAVASATRDWQRSPK